MSFSLITSFSFTTLAWFNFFKDCHTGKWNSMQVPGKCYPILWLMWYLYIYIDKVKDIYILLQLSLLLLRIIIIKTIDKKNINKLNSRHNSTINAPFRQRFLPWLLSSSCTLPMSKTSSSSYTTQRPWWRQGAYITLMSLHKCQWATTSIIQNPAPRISAYFFLFFRNIPDIGSVTWELAGRVKLLW